MSPMYEGSLLLLQGDKGDRGLYGSEFTSPGISTYTYCLH